MLNIQQRGDTIHFVGQLNRDTVIAHCPFALLKNIKGVVTFDLAELSHVDTAGLAWILQQVSMADAEKLQVKIRNLPAQLESLAKVTDVITLLPLES